MTGGATGGAAGAGRPGPTVGAGQGRAQLGDQVTLRLGILRGLSRYLARLRGPDGALVCPRHRVEHTGKNVYGALIDLYNWRYTRDETFLEPLRVVALRTVDNLGEDPESRVPVFLPGRVDPRNASTNAIDGGACADVLATLLEEVPEAFSDEERARIADALERHVEGYLRHAARDRPITAQRLWAGTGVARAARLLRRDDWAADALAGCARALDELTPDGISPYIPAGSDHCTHPGLADISTFYHSRTPGFVLYIHEVLGRPLAGRDAERVRGSLDALVAMRDGAFRKVLHNEAKAWYWESDYEVASHPFDVFALQSGARRFDSALYRDEAGRAMEEWIGHLDPDGGADSHHGRGVNFQCRVFWTGHAAWIARVLHDVALQGAPRAPCTLDLPAAGLVHVETERAVAVLRGGHPAGGNLFGCDLGGGQLQSLCVRPDARIARGTELLTRRRFLRRRPGSFAHRPASGPGALRRLAAVLAADRSDLRFRLYVASVEWRAGRRLGALGYALRHVVRRSLAESSAWCASHLDARTTQTVRGDEVLFEGGLAGRDGVRLPGSATLRRYRFLPGEVALEDELTLRDARGPVEYRLPDALADVEVRCEGAVARRAGARVVADARGGTLRLRITGRWIT